MTHEQQVLKFWENININKRLKEKLHVNGSFRFIDGPPFCSGKLHMGSLSVGFFKDIVLRYQRMCGKKCLNRLGFDTHGLPSESMVMKTLNLQTKQDIEQYGIDNFIKMCISMVTECAFSWKPVYERIARTIDFDDQYKTMDTNFMESTWWIFKNIYEKNLIYKAHKIMPYSYACETPLSNFEIVYKKVTENTIYVKFKSVNFKNTYFVAWTTTPWTLPSNIALCVNPNQLYVECIINNEHYIVAESSINNLRSAFDHDFDSIENFAYGKDMTNLAYEPLFNYIDFKYHKIVVDDYVKNSSDIGSGIVHIAPTHGEDDYRICLTNNVITKENIYKLNLIDSRGKFNCGDLCNMIVFDTNKLIIKKLKERNLVVKTQNYDHEYPHCPRSNTPLINMIIPAYFVEVTKVKNRMVELNKTINWSKPEIGKNRFGNWLEQAKDWCISRNRYFGTPIPIWESTDGNEKLVIGSIDELVDKAKLCYRPIDLHLNSIKDITIMSSSGKILYLTGTVLDCWFESGSVPYGQHHYPFENNNIFDDQEFLSDFVVEGLDQCRGWFYTLLVISTIVSNKAPFKNVVCSGLVLDSSGKKISKSSGNYIDPEIMVNKYGADVMRLYLAGSPLTDGDTLSLNDTNIYDIGKKLIQYKNAVNYYQEQIMINCNIGVKYLDHNHCDNEFDNWIMERVYQIGQNVSVHMDNYQLNRAVAEVLSFIDDLTNWYIRINKERFNDSFALSVLYTVLYNYNTIIAPFAPFLSEHIFHQITIDKKMSIHLLCSNKYIYDNDKIKSIEKLKNIVIALRHVRAKSKLHASLKIPIKECIVYCKLVEEMVNLPKLIELVDDEINCLNVSFKKMSPEMYVLKPCVDIRYIGKKYRKNASIVTSLIEKLSQKQLKEFEINGSIIVDQYVFDTNYMSVAKHFKNQMEIHEEFGLIFQTDMTFDETVHGSGEVRRFSAFIQHFRKELGLKPWNKIKVHFDSDKFINNVEQISEAIGMECDLYNGEQIKNVKTFTYHDLYGKEYQINVFVFIY